MITLIAARDINGAIGKDGGIPWDAPEDLAFFSRETRGGAIIMGRKTWESLPVKPLKGRMNIVVTSNPDLAEHTASSVDEAVKMANDAGYFRVYGIGGQGVYEALMPFAQRLVLTLVMVKTEDADAFFPDPDPAHWGRVTEQTIREANPLCRVAEYIRIRR
jgi:dihydrofolate reductase